MAQKSQRASKKLQASPVRAAEPPAKQRRSWRIPKVNSRDLGLGVLLVAVLIFVYLPALNGGLVWDDDGHVTRPELQSWRGLGRIWFQLGATQQYYPLLHSAFWLEHQLWGDAVLNYHLTNLALHAVSAILLVLLLRRLELPGPWIAAFLFALHPVSVESVAWISEQKNALSTVFYLGSALAYLRFDKTQIRSDYLTALALFVAALLSKSVTATLPAALLVVLWWKRGRLDLKRDVQPLAPWLVLGIASGAFTAWVERRYIGAQGGTFSLTLLQRVLVAGRVTWFYLAKLIWPANLMFVYPRWNVDPRVWWQWTFPLGALLLAAALWVLARRGTGTVSRGPLAAFLLFAGTLFPVMGFLNVYPFVFSFVADHFQYQASLGILVLAACGVAWAARKAAVLPVLVVAPLTFLSWNHSAVFRDAETLYTDTLARNPESWMAHTNLGLLQSRERGRSMEAISHLEEAVRLNPDSSETHLNLGVMLSDMAGRSSNAIAEYRTALRLNPNYTVAHNDLGNALADTPGGTLEAISEYQAALRLDPNYAEAHNNLGSTLSTMPGRSEEALKEFEAAVSDNPNLAEAQANLGTALAKLPGRAEEAVPHLQTALQLRPDMGPVRELLGKMQQAQAGSAATQGMKVQPTPAH
jgi:tetratricopeptide (TPR) repeat protein